MKIKLLTILLVLQTILITILLIKNINNINETEKLNNQYTCYKNVYDNGVITNECKDYFEDTSITDFTTFYIPNK